MSDVILIRQSEIDTHYDAVGDRAELRIFGNTTENGAKNNVFENALKGKDISKLSDTDIIELVYDERGKKDETGKLIYFTKVSKKNVIASLLKRFKDEKRDALFQLKYIR